MIRRSVIVLGAVGLVVALSLLAWRRWGRRIRGLVEAPVRIEDAPLAPVTARRSTGCERGVPSSADGVRLALPDGVRVLVHGPRRADTAEALPLVLVFHGYGDDAVHFASWLPVHEHVGEAAFTAYPDVQADWDIRGTRDVRRVERLVAALEARYCLDPSRVYAFGFSWGGKLVSRLACSPSPIRAFAIGDASYHGADPHETCPPQDVFVTVRTHDTDERPERGRDAAKAWAAHAHCRGEPSASQVTPSCRSFQGCDGGKRVVLCEDGFFDPSWPTAWNHTVLPASLDLAWSFFDGRLR